MNHCPGRIALVAVGTIVKVRLMDYSVLKILDPRDLRS